jgi:AcrR family transcriptional regulator
VAVFAVSANRLARCFFWGTTPGPERESFMVITGPSLLSGRHVPDLAVLAEVMHAVRPVLRRVGDGRWTATSSVMLCGGGSGIRAYTPAMSAHVRREPRGPYAKGVNRRQEILEAALDLFAEKGFEGTSLTAIGEAIGVTREGMRHYFRSREDLLLAVMAAADERARDFPVTPGDDTLLSRIIASVEHNANVPGLIALYTTLVAGSVASGNARSRAVFTERFEKLRIEIARAVELGQARGEIRQDLPPTAVASLVVAASDGLSMQWMLDRRVDIVGGMRLLRTLMLPCAHG